MSASGQYQTALGTKIILISNDFGNTWKPVTNIPDGEWTSVSMNATGQYQIAVSQSSGIWCSIDFGHTWTKTSSDEQDDLNWTSIAISSSGQYSTLVGIYTGIWTSENPLTPPGMNYGDYLYWDSNINEWAVGSESISIGYQSGQTGQSSHSIALGYQAGQIDQGISAIAIGKDAGNNGQGEYAIAIGYAAGFTGQAPNSIVLNASGNELDAGVSGFYVAPINPSTESHYVLQYDEANSRITYNSVSTTNAVLTSDNLLPDSGVAGQFNYIDNGTTGELYLHVGTKWVKVVK
jgi:hypothetical protein